MQLPIIYAQYRMGYSGIFIVEITVKAMFNLRLSYA